MKKLFQIALILMLPACVTAGNNSQSELVSTPVENRNDVAVTAATDANMEAVESSLSEDLEAVERLGQVFLESSFALYDRLLNENISDKDTVVARAAVDECRNKYNELVAAINKLQGTINRPDVREALPLSIEGNKEELEKILASFSAYVPAEFSSEDYSVNEGKYLTVMMFPKLTEQAPEYLTSLPKANRDALLFLDHLKRISDDLTSLSTTLTAWIYDAASFDAEAFVH